MREDRICSLSRSKGGYLCWRDPVSNEMLDPSGSCICCIYTQCIAFAPVYQVLHSGPEVIGHFLLRVFWTPSVAGVVASETLILRPKVKPMGSEDYDTEDYDDYVEAQDDV
ncbi:hypothetical protein Tco_1165926 [Tanacetum coccineum]